MTEDEAEGRLYRCSPEYRNRLCRPEPTSGAIDVARILEGDSGAIVWHELPDRATAGRRFWASLMVGAAG